MSQNKEQIAMSQNDQEQTTQPASRYPEAMRTLFAAYARHGKPLRGLMSTAKSPSFQGRFGRMFPHSLPAATYGTTDTESRLALMALGAAMTSKFDAPKDGFDGEESGIPALYTYFGQFIDHDITFDPMTTLIQHSDPDAITDFRTPALDLDNVYGRGPSDQPYMYDNNGTKFLLGNNLDNGAPDLQRNNADPARALIGDPRNDENSIISQFQALMLRFHNRVVDDNPELDFPSVQKIVRWHYQWVIVHDFLPQLIRKSVLDALKTHGRYDRKKLKFYHWKNNPFMPVEFSAAAYRLGHSMVRPGYRLNDGDTLLLPIFPVPESVDGAPTGGISSGLTGFQAMAKNRGIDWGCFVDFGDPRAYGGDPDKITPATADMKRRLQFAYRLDTSVVTPLSVLPESVAPDKPRSLAQRNLLRGFELGLPTGQSVARAMGVTPLTDDQIIIGKAVDQPEGDDVLGPISTLPQLSAFWGKCPLWTYILAEAATNLKEVSIPVTPPTNVMTPQLGEVGGRIVAEVFLGMLFGDKESFLSAHPGWVPTIETEKGDFRLRDIVAYALAVTGYFERVPFAESVPEFDVSFDPGRQLHPAELFRHPFVVELMGAGFDKPADARYYTLRFPRVLEIHQDHTVKDTASFDELQEMALRSKESPKDNESEERDWLERLRRNDYLDERSRSRSPSDDSNPPLTETNAVHIYHYAGKQNAHPQGKTNTSAGLPYSDDSFFHSSKRKMVSSTSPSAIKRAKLEG